MSPSHTAAASRPILGFVLKGLSERDETLFKAMVRLLDHRTMQRWVHRPDSPDLHVVADAVSASATDAAAGVGAVPSLVLTLSTQPAGRAHCLGLPLRADALEAELNMLGEERLAVRAAPASTPRAAESQSTVMKLLRWPAPELLATPERLKLAALMVKRPFDAAWLQQRSDVAPATCAQFIADLREAGLLADAHDASTAPVAAASAAHVASGATAPRQPPVLRSGLLSRIRQRINLLVRPSLT